MNSSRRTARNPNPFYHSHNACSLPRSVNLHAQTTETEPAAVSDFLVPIPVRSDEDALAAGSHVESNSATERPPAALPNTGPAHTAPARRLRFSFKSRRKPRCRQAQPQRPFSWRISITTFPFPRIFIRIAWLRNPPLMNRRR